MPNASPTFWLIAGPLGGEVRPRLAVKGKRREVSDRDDDVLSAAHAAVSALAAAA